MTICIKHGFSYPDGSIECPKCFPVKSPRSCTAIYLAVEDKLTKTLEQKFALKEELRHICGALGEFYGKGQNTTVEKIRFMYKDRDELQAEIARLQAIESRAGDVETLRVTIKHERFDTIEDPFIEYQAGRMSKGKLCEYIARTLSAWLKEGK